MGHPHPDFVLSRAGWELYHAPRRYPRANYPVSQAERITKVEYQAGQAATEQKENAMRGMKRLANLTETLMQSIDAEADKAADELSAAVEDAKTAVGEFKSHAGEVRKVAAGIRAQLAQITNSPTQGSGS